MAKKYSKDSLYFSDRKAYYAQKVSASNNKSDNSDILKELFDSREDLEKAVGFAGDGWSRSNSLGRGKDSMGINNTLSKRFPNLAGKGSLYTNKGGYITIQESVWLCQRAWEEFQLFRNTIEAMVEFSVSNIKLSCTNKSAKIFCEAWLEAINIDGLAEQFYREMYRSSNIFVNKIHGTIEAKDVKDLNQLYASAKRIPVKYTILNPAQIALHGGVTNDNEIYKVLSPYEIKRLSAPKTEAEKILFKKLDPKIQNQIKEYAGVGQNDQIYVKLEDTDYIFHQKQDYEYFAVPLFYGVLDDIELKLEMKKADRTVLATVENMILLVTMGGMKGKDGQELAPNPEHMAYVRKLFNNSQAKRILVADFTTKVDYIIPDISKVVGEAKYKQVNKDIAEGLQSIFGSDEKFSNQMTKVRVFVERLKSGQRKFKKWLENELKAVCAEMGYSKCPTVSFSAINLEDTTQLYRVYTRLCELGILTPMETIEAIKEGVFPNEHESVEDQDNFIKHKDAGRYVPQIFNRPEDRDPEDGSAKSSPGRPEGSGVPIGDRAQRVVGNVEQISLEKFQNNLAKYDRLKKDLGAKVKAHYKLDKITEGHFDFIESIAKKVACNVAPKDWGKNLAKIIEEKALPNNESLKAKIDETAETFDLDDDLMAALVYHSSKFTK